MTNAAGLDANAYLPLKRRSDGPLYEVKSPGFGYFDRPVRFSHFRLLSIWKNSCVVSPIVLEVSILVLIESAAVWRFCRAFSGWETRVATFTGESGRRCPR